MHCVLQCNSVAVPWGLIRNNALQQLYSLCNLLKILLPLRPRWPCWHWGVTSLYLAQIIHNNNRYLHYITPDCHRCYLLQRSKNISYWLKAFASHPLPFVSLVLVQAEEVGLVVTALYNPITNINILLFLKWELLSQHDSQKTINQQHKTKENQK